VKKNTAQQLLALSENKYNSHAQEFANTWPFFWRELGYLKKYIRTNQSILDIGCGNGRLLDIIHKKGVQYTGIDSSKSLIEIAQIQRGDKGKFIHANALHLPFSNTSFDRIFSIAVLHHIPSKQFRTRFITEAYRALKPRGTLILTVWNLWQWRFFTTHLLFLFKKILGMSNLDFGDTILKFGQLKKERFIHAFTKKEIYSLLEKNGFRITSITQIKRRSGYANYVIVAKKQNQIHHLGVKPPSGKPQVAIEPPNSKI